MDAKAKGLERPAPPAAPLRGRDFMTYLLSKFYGTTVGAHWWGIAGAPRFTRKAGVRLSV